VTLKVFFRNAQGTTQVAGNAQVDCVWVQPALGT
jgi:hypothetical protein